MIENCRRAARRYVLRFYMRLEHNRFIAIQAAHEIEWFVRALSVISTGDRGMFDDRDLTRVGGSPSNRAIVRHALYQRPK